ncbi:CYTH and CHAD domain-containing protein [Nocardia takedensis]
MRDQLERESKWEVDRNFVLPDLRDLVPGSRVEKKSVQLTSTYYDTPELDLLARGVTLRRREGDDESGWQLKIPRAEGRLELSTPLTPDLPRELAEIVAGIAFGKELGPLTSIYTLRDRHKVFDADGELIVEIAEDIVEATPADGSGDVTAWREVEIESGPRTEQTPRPLVKALVKAGARASQYPSKLSRVLPGRSRPRATESKGARAVHDYLNAQIDAVFAGDVELRRGSDPIHDTRVATRRLRSTLRVFGPLLDRAAIAGVEDELKWYASVLGEVRDCHVQRARFADRIAALPPELVLGPVAATIDGDLLATQVRRRADLTEVMNSDRYRALLLTLNRWRTKPPFAERIRARDLVERARKAAKKADKRLATALADGGDESLHRARKASKRARYAAELHRPARKPGRAEANIAYYKRLQKVLGDHNDGVVAAEFLWRTATTAGAQGENGFTFGLLYANEKHEAEVARAKVADVAAKGR